MLLLLLIPVIIFVTTLVRIRLDEREKLRETYLHVEETSLLASIIHELQKDWFSVPGSGPSFSLQIKHIQTGWDIWKN